MRTRQLGMSMAVALFCIAQPAHAVSPGMFFSQKQDSAVIVLQEVIPVGGSSAADLFHRARVWTTISYVSAKDVTQFSDVDAGIVINKGWFPEDFVGTPVDIGHSLIIEAKEGRYRYTLYDLQWTGPQGKLPVEECFGKDGKPKDTWFGGALTNTRRQLRSLLASLQDGMKPDDWQVGDQRTSLRAPVTSRDVVYPRDKAGNITFQDVVTVGGASVDDLYIRAMKWTTHAYVSAKDVTHMADKKLGIVIAKGWFDDTIMGAATVITGHTLVIEVRDGKYRCTIDRLPWSSGKLIGYGVPLETCFKSGDTPDLGLRGSLERTRGRLFDMIDSLRVAMVKPTENW